MGISINTNIAASRAGMYLKSNHANLQKSLDRLSSGRRITEPADDAGGLAVSMKLEHTAKVLNGVSNNISNAISLMQVQDGALKSVADIVSRIGELQAMYNDPTKSTSDKAAYDAEFGDLQNQISAIEANTKFNDVDVFGEATTATDVTVYLDENLSTSNGNIRLNDVAILGATNGSQLAALVGFDDLSDIPVNNTTAGDVSKTLEEVAGHRADNGGQVRRLQYALANAQTQITNLTAANGRIVDVDIAAESANLARQQVLTQASAAMTAQANMSNDVALMLLQ
jgi:flagellin